MPQIQEVKRLVDGRLDANGDTQCLPGVSVDESLPVHYLYRKEILTTCPAGIKLAVRYQDLERLGPADRKTLLSRKDEYKQLGLVIDMVECWDDWHIVVYPEGQEPISLFAGSVVPDGQEEKNPAITRKVSASVVGLINLFQKGDPKTYKMIKEQGLVIAHRWKNIELNVLAIPGRAAKKVKLLDSTADDNCLYAFPRSDQRMLRFEGKETKGVFGNPVAVICTL